MKTKTRKINAKEIKPVDEICCNLYYLLEDLETDVQVYLEKRTKKNEVSLTESLDALKKVDINEIQDEDLSIELTDYIDEINFLVEEMVEKKTNGRDLELTIEDSMALAGEHFEL